MLRALVGRVGERLTLDARRQLAVFLDNNVGWAPDELTVDVDVATGLVRAILLGFASDNPMVELAAAEAPVAAWTHANEWRGVPGASVELEWVPGDHAFAGALVISPRLHNRGGAWAVGNIRGETRVMFDRPPVPVEPVVLPTLEGGATPGLWWETIVVEQDRQVVDALLVLLPPRPENNRDVRHVMRELVPNAAVNEEAMDRLLSPGPTPEDLQFRVKLVQATGAVFVSVGARRQCESPSTAAYGPN